MINSHALYRLSYSGIYRNIFTDEANYVERKTGLEPATPTLARLCSTTELLPRLCQQRYYYIITSLFVKLCRKTFAVNSLSINVMFNRLSYISQWCQYFLPYFCVFSFYFHYFHEKTVKRIFQSIPFTAFYFMLLSFVLISLCNADRHREVNLFHG